MFDKQWVYYSEKNKNVHGSSCPDIDPDNKYHLPEFIKNLLANRLSLGSFTLDSYFNPCIDNLSSPFEIDGMMDAVDRILMAQESDEKVTVFGDYDCDGITATFVLYHFLTKYMNMNVDYYIPNRLTEGYGMSEQSVRKIADSGTTLIITVDNGIAAANEIQLLAEMGVDVVVTDHHKKPEIIPDACAVVDPVNSRENDPNKYLAGCGVAFKLVCALAIELGIPEVTEAYIPVVSVGTIGDSVPLLGDNRIIVRHGLEHMVDTTVTGLKALLEQMPARKNSSGGVTGSYIMYSIVPKINAAGRLGNSQMALEMLLCENMNQASELATRLIDENTKRQEKESEIASQATNAQNILTKDSDAIVIAYNKDWHHGVIGIVASRLVEKFNKPSFVMAAAEDNTIVGSGRSVDGFDLHAALTHAKEYIVKFGGHEAACGLTISLDNVQPFIEKINEYAQSFTDKQLPPPHIVIDSLVDPEELTVQNIELLDKMEPFGMGNPEPVLCIPSLQVERCSLVGADGKHVKIRFSYIGSNNEKKYIDGIAFSKSAFAPLIGKTKKAGVVFTPSINTWNGVTSVSLLITDICDGEYSIDKDLRCVYNDAYITCRGFTLDRNILAHVYKAMSSASQRFGQDDIMKIRDTLQNHGINCTWYILKTALAVFTELGLIKKLNKGMYECIAQQDRVDLAASKIFTGNTAQRKDNNGLQ
ncbi:MAG: single-stranded-DNA-specific exonuclease RecJ [Ruminococcaceae bacterium]|nr:single-stranded-DNA-specific exonuclease RecJ [Oscillospiraceae bacterium]